MTLLTDPLVIRAMSLMPGNAIPSVNIPQVDGSTAIAGQAPSTWDRFAASAKNTLLWPFHATASAFDVIKNAPSNAAAAVSAAEDSVIGAVTGLGSWIKWVAAAIIALAVIYLVAVLAPALKGKR